MQIKDKLASGVHTDYVCDVHTQIICLMSSFNFGKQLRGVLDAEPHY